MHAQHLSTRYLHVRVATATSFHPPPPHSFNLTTHTLFRQLTHALLSYARCMIRLMFVGPLFCQCSVCGIGIAESCRSHFAPKPFFCLFSQDVASSIKTAMEAAYAGKYVTHTATCRCMHTHNPPRCFVPLPVHGWSSILVLSLLPSIQFNLGCCA